MLYQTHVRVHLGNIRRNLEGIRKAVGPDRKILIAVKADGYGHGAVALSQMVEKHGLVDWLGVATVTEGRELRKAGITLPILKLSPAFPCEMKASVNYGITLAVCEKENIIALESLCIALGRRTPVHLKVDTGMARIGVPVEEAVALARYIQEKCPHLDLQGVFTHLPVSDEGEGPHPAFTAAQAERFRKLAEEIQEALGRRLLVHCSNSGATIAHPAAWLDMVRPGIMIYGTYTGADPERRIPLAPGMSMHTRVSFVKDVKAGTAVGYGLTWTAERDTRIATLPAGYADGFNRLFSNRGRVLIEGKSYPVVGRVCMDQCMVDLGPDSAVKVGDEVVLMGRSGDLEISCAEWAEKLGTITYEVTCQINKRVERVYDEE